MPRRTPLAHHPSEARNRMIFFAARAIAKPYRPGKAIEAGLAVKKWRDPRDGIETVDVWYGGEKTASFQILTDGRALILKLSVKTLKDWGPALISAAPPVFVHKK